MRILIVGTGPREIYLAAACQSHGHELVSSGPWDWVCLPLPRSPLPEEWKDTLPRGQKILCGQPEEALRDEAGARGWRLVNALRDDIFVRENASLTAEGALCAAMACQDGALQGQHCLVIGYGRIGQALTRMLRGVGAGVTVAARREESRILAGEGSVPIEGIHAVLPHTDFLLPAGKLREPKSSCRRADIVIVTKCPGDITPTEEHGIERSLNLQPWQKLFYSHYGYGNLVPMRNYIDPLNDYSDFSFSKPQDITLDDLKANKYNVVLLTGIASPHQLESDFRQFCQFTPIRFEDHHNFTKKDIDLIASKTKQSESGNTIVVTTEKDAMRLIEYMRNNPGDDAEFIRNRYQDFYVLPVEVKFMKEKQDEFNQIILSYVQKNSRTSTLSKRL